MKENEVKKRKWVMPAAIVFLSVMLILTFFSNTIMNRTLPEVAAQYAVSGAITARIRGAGTVTANESAEVKATQSNTVSERLVQRVGDEVDKGDILFRFENAESGELEGAREQLHEYELELERLLLDLSRPDGSLAGQNSSVQSARNAVQAAQLGVQTAQTGVQSAQADLNNAQTTLNLLPPFSEADLAAAQTALNNAMPPNNSAQSELTAATADAAAKQQTLSNATALRDKLIAEDVPPGTVVDSGVMANAIQAVIDATFDSETANATLARAAANASATQAVVDNAQARIAALIASRDSRVAAAANVRDAQQRLISAQQGVTAAQQGVAAAQQSLADAILSLSDAQTDSGINSSLEAIKVRELKRQIEEAKEAVEKFEKEGNKSEVIAPVAGIVTEINASPGDSVTPGDILMKIEDVSRGYSLNFPVSSEQASRVNVGDMGEVDRGWWGGWEELRATLSSIRNDPQNPQTGRILHFTIAGEVKSGDQLNITIAQRTENYSIIVPNSAIRSDTNGDFVLVVMSRSSPLGNRYIATRVDVNILASDDVNTAVSGALSSWGDFVIRTSSVPIEPGMQVRLVDNP